MKRVLKKSHLEKLRQRCERMNNDAELVARRNESRKKWIRCTRAEDGWIVDAKGCVEASQKTGLPVGTIYNHMSRGKRETIKGWKLEYLKKEKK